MTFLGTVLPIVQAPMAADALAPLRATAEAAGRGDFSPLWVGQNTTGCSPRAAADLTRVLAGVGA